jgi:tRNA (guanine-N7-)-methyltransferase
MAGLLPQLLLGPEAGRDPKSYFAEPIAEVWLEIGFGAGEHLLWQAEQHREIGLIGAEPYVCGVAKLLSKLAPLLPSQGEGEAAVPPCASPELLSGSVLFPQAPEQDVPRGPAFFPPVYGAGGGAAAGGGNIRLYSEDARDIVAALPNASLGRVFILFPDPWPKTRHHKRRFIQMGMLDELARVMKPGAQLRFATDDRSYLVWALERLMGHRKFAWMAKSPADWRRRPADWPPTRYEAKAIREHRRCTYLCFARR